MPQVINTNIGSLNAQRNLNKSQNAMQTAMTRLSSGLRINSAKDDAAGQAIVERMTSQIRGLNQAARNANDGVSLAQTAEGGLGETSNLLQRLRELAVQAASDTNSLSDRQALDAEAKSLIAEINNIAQTTQFNGKGVLNGDTVNLDFQVGANAGQMIRVSSVDARAGYLGGNMVRGHALYLDTTTGTKNYAVGDFTSIDVNGVTIDLSANGAKATSIDDVVAAVNKLSESTGVMAVRSSRAVVEASEFATDGFVEGDQFLINGVQVTITSPSGTLTQQEVLDSINKVADKTGVRAEIADTADTGGVGDIKLVSSGDIVITRDPSSAANNPVTQEGTYFRGINFANTSLEGLPGGTNTVDVTLTMANGVEATDAGRLQALLNSTVTDDSGLEVVRDFTVQNLNIASKQGAEQALDTLDFAIQQVNGMRGKLGALQNRFISAVSNLQSQSENITAARSRIQDADFAAETAELSRTQILQQAGTAMLAQANAAPQSVLSLLRG